MKTAETMMAMAIYDQGFLALKDGDWQSLTTEQKRVFLEAARGLLQRYYEIRSGEKVHT